MSTTRHNHVLQADHPSMKPGCPGCASMNVHVLTADPGQMPPRFTGRDILKRYMFTWPGGQTFEVAGTLPRAIQAFESRVGKTRSELGAKVESLDGAW